MGTYKEVTEAFKAGKIDIAWLSNVPALEVVESGKGAVFAQTIDSKGSSSYRSVLIVHKDSKIQSLKDIIKPDNGLVYGDGDAKSTSGHLVPLYYAFVQNKVNDPRTLFKEIKTGNFKTNATRAAQKEVDVATNNDVELGFFREEHPELYAKLRVIWTSQDIPQSPLVWRRDIPVALKRQISQFVTSYGKNEAERKALLQANDLSGFKKSSNRQLITIADLEMFSAWRRIWNNRELTGADRKHLENLLTQRGSRLEIMLREAEDY
jgi:phosphonate transport system substrate-binding protein